MEKKRKAEEKRNRRNERKATESVSPHDMTNEETQAAAQEPIENSIADDN